MSRILVTPEMLLRVAEQCSKAHEQLEAMIHMLNQNIHMLASGWEGTTRSRFYADFQKAHREMTQTTEHIQRTSLELKAIAQRFKAADERAQPTPVVGHVLGAYPIMRGPAAYGDMGGIGRSIEDSWNAFQREVGEAWDTAQRQAGEVWDGVKKGAGQLRDGVIDTAVSLYEDPIGTGKEMLYNATIGTVEDIWNTGVWGARMVFSDEYRKKFVEDTKKEADSAGGVGTYLGTQSALFFGGALLNRAGIRGKGPLNKKHDDLGGGSNGGNSSSDRGGDGNGKKSRNEGAGNLKDLPSIKERVKEIRSELPSKLKKSGNFGYAEVDIQGINKKEYFAHSSVNNATDKGVLPGMSLKPPGEPVFKAKKVDPDNARIDTPEAYLRDYDTEYKILNDIASQLGNNKNAKGTINLFTERLTCQSCTDVIMDFRREYPNITVNVLTNDGKVVK